MVRVNPWLLILAINLVAGPKRAWSIAPQNKYLNNISFDDVLLKVENLQFQKPTPSDRSILCAVEELAQHHELPQFYAGLSPKETVSRAFSVDGLARKILRLSQRNIAGLADSARSIDAAQSMELVQSWLLDNLDECETALLALVVDRPEWGWRMADATGKLGGSGFFDGNLNALGTYDECLPIHVMSNLDDIVGTNVPHGRFDGAYFLGRLKISSTIKPPSNDSELALGWEEEEEEEEFYSHYEDVLNPAVVLKRLQSSNQNKKDAVVLESPYHEDYGIDWSLLGNPEPIVQDIILGTLFQRPHLGICLPSVCKVEVVEVVLEEIIQEVLAFLVQNDTIDYPFAYDIGSYYYTEEKKQGFTGGDLACIVIILLFGLLVIVGTCTEIFGYRDEKVNNYKSTPVKVLLCFSLYTNGSKLFNTDRTKQNIECINGLRVFSMVWVILGHTYWVGGAIPWQNPFGVGDIFFDWYMNVVFEGLFAVDTFFTLGGFLMSFLTLKELDKRNGKLNILFVYLHRYCRLTPLYGIVILFVSTLLVHMGQGPFWMYMHEESDKCAENWWTNILYINNFVAQDRICLEVSWYLAVDFQVFLIGPPLVWIMWHYRRIGWTVAGVALAVSCAVPGILTGIRDWPPSITFTIMSLDWMDKFYVRPYNRAAPYIWGVIFGYIMHHLPKKYHRREGEKIHWYYILAGWLISALICLSCIFGLTEKWLVNFSCILSEKCFSTTEAVFFAAFSRLAWAIGISWVIFACQTGYAGFIGHVLGYPLWNPLSRMTYECYLIHLPMIYAFHKSRKSVMYFDKFFMFYVFMGHLIVSVILSVFLTLMFESPFIGLEKLLFSGPQKKRAEFKRQQSQIQEQIDAQKIESENGEANEAFEDDNVRASECSSSSGDREDPDAIVVTNASH
ncbi:hypothetical protein TCAL_08592 [Tigriopus californicus]|uniref:Uncharacterized protein n=1 Tax=Tigriopus californicus TaxID=6832 RepID=A0A553P3L9_TIGCA|nr:nose resistant to fluoxetine protein 6-like [Tigriopus californicus]TRY72279.1 hypothetical protein TCAL_08592 [Tigriopus californicus]